MNPNASLKSLKLKVRAMASRPGTSFQPGNALRADFRASADSRSAMAGLPFHNYFTTMTSQLAGSATGLTPIQRLRSEERRVGKECRSRWSLDHLKE